MSEEKCLKCGHVESYRRATGCAYVLNPVQIGTRVQTCGCDCAYAQPDNKMRGCRECGEMVQHAVECDLNKSINKFPPTTPLTDAEVDAFNKWLHTEDGGDVEQLRRCWLAAAPRLVERVREQAGVIAELKEALTQIAAFSDEGASRNLKDSGSYRFFDEPGSVQIARTALAKVEGKENDAKTQ